MEKGLIRIKSLMPLKELKKEFVLINCETKITNTNHEGEKVSSYTYSDRFPSYYFEIGIRRIKYYKDMEILVNGQKIKDKKEGIRLLKNLMFADTQYTQQKKSNNMNNYEINNSLIYLSRIMGKKLYDRFILPPDEVIAGVFRFQIYYISQALRSYLLQKKLYKDYDIENFYNFLEEIEKETNRQDSMEIDDYVDKWIDEIKSNDYQFKKTRHDR